MILMVMNWVKSNINNSTSNDNANDINRNKIIIIIIVSVYPCGVMLCVQNMVKISKS